MELSEIRTKIDAVDDQLLSLFLERMALSEEVAAYKNQHQLPILHIKPGIIFRQLRLEISIKIMGI